MNQRFKQKYDELRESNPAKPHEENSQPKIDAENEFYDKPGNNRNIRFAWPDGRMKFYSYAYLVSCEVDVKEDINSIAIEFTSDMVTLKGYKLRDLFLALFNQMPCVITQVDPRYVSSVEDVYIVIEILVDSRDAKRGLP
jgi:hypothetical protein